MSALSKAEVFMLLKSHQFSPSLSITSISQEGCKLTPTDMARIAGSTMQETISNWEDSTVRLKLVRKEGLRFWDSDGKCRSLNGRFILMVTKYGTYLVRYYSYNLNFDSGSWVLRYDLIRVFQDDEKDEDDEKYYNEEWGIYE